MKAFFLTTLTIAFLTVGFLGSLNAREFGREGGEFHNQGHNSFNHQNVQNHPSNYNNLREGQYNGKGEAYSHGLEQGASINGGAGTVTPIYVAPQGPYPTYPTTSAPQ